MDLIIPACADHNSSEIRPKYLLTHPNGNLMVAEAIQGLNLKSFRKIYIIILKKHDQKYSVSTILKNQFKKLGLLMKLEILLLKESSSEPDTVYQTLVKKKINGPFFIKDVDNFFECKEISGNCVCYHSLEETKRIHAASKSYILLSEKNSIVNIVEKQVISDSFCAGGYSFENAKDFIKQYKALKHIPNLYISHIIYQMILSGHTFSGQKVNNFIDWGTMRDWNLFREKFSTLFIDIDGTLVKSSSEFMEPYWGQTEGIEKNVVVINRLFDTGTIRIILTTTRPENYKVITEKQLKKVGLKYHQVIYGLDHSKRIIINDYSRSNPYKSCDAINLRRDSTDLTEMLEESLNLEDY